MRRLVSISEEKTVTGGGSQGASDILAEEVSEKGERAYLRTT